MVVDVKPGYNFMTDIEVEKMPAMKWLIKDILPTGTLSILCGDAGTGKSFLALDWALSIATGKAWKDHDVLQGKVVYIAAEGIAGIGKRIRAWKQANNITPQTETGLFILGEPVQLLRGGERALVDALVARFEVSPPVLVIIDTLARCMVGGEENGARDMGEVVSATDAIRSTFEERWVSDQQKIPMHVILIHHTPKEGKGPRGHSSLRGAVDVVIEVAKRRMASDGVGVKVTCDKQKDADAFDPIQLLLKKVTLESEVSEESEPDSSCVLVADTSSEGQSTLKSPKRGVNKLNKRNSKSAWEVVNG